METKSFLITGGCGFIGISLISKLLKNNPDVHIRILDNFTTGTAKDLTEVVKFTKVSGLDIPDQKGIFLVEGDIRNKENATHCAKGIDCIVHLAANTGVSPSVQNPILDMDCNVIGTVNMLEAARIHKVKKFIFASSGAPIGEVEPPIHEELPAHPVSPYGASKLAGEGYCSAYFRTFGIDTVCLRFGNVYGPKSKKKSSVVAKFIRQALAGDTCLIHGDGTQTRDFLYIDDLVRAVLSCIEKNVGGETFQIANGNECTVWEIANLIAKALKGRGVEMLIAHDAPRTGDVKRNFSDTRKAKEMLDWTTEIELEEGIEKTLDYFLGINRKI